MQLIVLSFVVTICSVILLSHFYYDSCLIVADTYGTLSRGPLYGEVQVNKFEHVQRCQDQAAGAGGDFHVMV